MRLLGLVMFFGMGPRRILIARADDAPRVRRTHRPRSAAAFEPPGTEPVSRYMTSVPFVRLIGCVPAPVQLLLNVEPPLKLIWSAISCVQFDPPADAPP